MKKINLKQKLFPIKAWLRRHRIAVLIIGGATLIAVASVTSFFLLAPEEQKEQVISIVTPKPKPKFYSPLTGMEVQDEAATKQATTAVMLENSPDARPQSGLKEAGVVYEAIAEGGITRFLAVYQTEKPELVGPVRSLRMYYVDWLAPYNASIAHVGGSAASLNEVRNGSYRDIDQFFNANTYWRATDRYAPHNVYTSFERLDNLNQEKGYTQSEFKGFARTDPAAAAEPTANSIDVKVSSSMYNSTYTYDRASNTYARHQGGQPHLDREKGQISPSVVIAMMVDMQTVQEDGARESVNTTAGGRAVIFQNGQATEANWKKPSRSEQIEFVDNEGKVVELVRGQTWITAVPNGRGSVSWQ